MQHRRASMLDFRSYCACGGCVEWSDRVGIHTDDREQDEAMAAALSFRSSTHRSPRWVCLRLWTMPEEEIKLTAWKVMSKKQLQFIKNHFNRSSRGLVRSSKTPTRRLSFNSIITPVLNASTPPPVARPNTGSNDVVVSPSKNRQINFSNHTFCSNGKQFSFDLPNSHRIVHDSHYSSLLTDRQSLKQFHDVTNLQQCSCRSNVAKFKAIMATAMASAPAMACTAAAYCA